jgi:hypothetical protein
MPRRILIVVAVCLGFAWPAMASPWTNNSCGICANSVVSSATRAPIGVGAIASASFVPPAPATEWSVGSKRLLFMRLIFPDDITEPISVASADALMTNVSRWYREKSYGTLNLVSDVTPLLEMPFAKSSYPSRGMARLLDDARAVAAQRGFNPDDYDLDIARFTPVPTWDFGGSAIVGGKGLWLQSSSLSIVIHELGHNFGLEHANFWAAGADSVIGPGAHEEYGNLFDIMGQTLGDPDPLHFNAIWLNRLEWLNSSFVTTVTTSGVYRLHAFDVATLVSGTSYALKIQKDQTREYWAEFRQKFTSNPSSRNGIILNWSPWQNSRAGTHLLDTTPGSPAGNASKDDSPLTLGRTLSDLEAGIHLTPLAVNANSNDRSIEVQVHLGFFSNNISPSLILTADRPSVEPGEEIRFIASAADADGDPLAFHWDFGDLSVSSNSPSVAKSWPVAGEYAVRCVVSDMKGGVASRSIIVTVGSPTTFRISGRITDGAGQSLEGVRVHNGATGSAYRGAYTDSDGDFSLVNVAVGSYVLQAVKYGHNLVAAGWSNPVTVGADVTGINWTARRYPMVSVTATDSSATETESGSDTGTFTITRSGDLDFAVTITFGLGGTARFNSGFNNDYTLSAGGSTSPFTLFLPAGVASTNIILLPRYEQRREGTETVALTLLEDVGYYANTASATIAITDSVGRIIPDIFWDELADIVYGTPLGPDQLNAFTFDEGTLTYDPPAGTVLNAGEAQQLAVIFTPDDPLRYEPATNSVIIDVTKKSLTITANDITAVHGAPVTFSASYNGFVNGDTAANLDVPASFTTDATPTSPIGSYPIIVSGASDANYSIAFFPSTLTISRAATTGVLTSSPNPALLGQLVTFTFTASAVAPSIAMPNGPVRFRIDGATYDMPSLVNGVASITTSSLSLGTHSVTAEYSGTPNFSPTLKVLDPEQLIQSPPTITWPTPLEIVYGTALSSTQLNATCSVPGTFIYDPPAGTVLNAGQGQVLSVTFTPSNSTFSTLTTNVFVNILKTTLTVTPADKTKIYGAPLPSFDLAYVGFVNGDTVSALDSLPSVTTAATAASPVGSYALIGVGGLDFNYQFNFVDGTLSVTPAPLTISAVNTNKVYGAPLPLFAVIYGGFVNGDIPENLDTPVAFTTAATISSDVGAYVIEPAGATDLNYAIQFVTGTLEVSRATSTATLTSSSNPALPGQQVTFTFTAGPIAPSVATPTGMALFKIGATAAQVPLVDGVATFSSSTLAIGAHTVEVECAGNANWIGITNRLTPDQLINTPPIATTDQIERRLPNGAEVLLSTLLSNDTDADGDTIAFVFFSATSANGGAVTRQGDWIRYSAPAGFTNDDSFTYTISDGRGQLVVGVVNIRVNSDPVRSPNLTITPLANGSYRIRFDGIAGVIYRIEHSPLNPAVWQTLGNATANAVGSFEIVDTPPAGSPQRFYRSVHP